MSKGGGSVREIGRLVEQSTKSPARSVEQADRTSTTVDGLARAAQRIGEVVKLIQDIGSQTQPARAQRDDRGGARREGGEGFAVVASEVKSLAARTAKATEDIARQISAIRQETRRDGLGDSWHQRHDRPN